MDTVFGSDGHRDAGPDTETETESEPDSQGDGDGEGDDDDEAPANQGLLPATSGASAAEVQGVARQSKRRRRGRSDTCSPSWWSELVANLAEPDPADEAADETCRTDGAEAVAASSSSATAGVGPSSRSLLKKRLSTCIADAFEPDSSDLLADLEDQAVDEFGQDAGFDEVQMFESKLVSQALAAAVASGDGKTSATSAEALEESLEGDMMQLIQQGMMPEDAAEEAMLSQVLGNATVSSSSATEPQHGDKVLRCVENCL